MEGIIKELKRDLEGTEKELANERKKMEEIKEFLLNELNDERKNMLMGEENHYSYLYMILNDIGFTA